MRENGHIAGDQADLDLHAQFPAIMIFVRLNFVSGSTWTLAPLSPVKHSFFTFSESELGAFMHKHYSLHPVLRSLIGHSDSERRLTQADIISDWLPTQAPGVLIQNLIAPVDPRSSGGQRLAIRQRRRAGIADIAAAIRIMTPSEIRTHVNMLREESFDLHSYYEKGVYPTWFCKDGRLPIATIGVQGARAKLSEVQTIQGGETP